IRGLVNLHQYYGDAFPADCPTGSGKQMTLFEDAEGMGRRLESIFLAESSGRRPGNGGPAPSNDDPLWQDRLLTYGDFHGDTGRGLGASHQTGWTGLVASLTDFFERVKPEILLREQTLGERPVVTTTAKRVAASA